MGLHRLWTLRGKIAGERWASEHNGQTIVLLALFMVALIAMVGLALDGGYLLIQRRRMQNAADAGALAGARQLALAATDSQINSAIQNYAVTRNGAATFTATYSPGGQAVGRGSVPAGATGVVVNANTAWNTFFLSVIRLSHLSASASAAGAFGNVTAPSGYDLQPIARKCDQPSLAACNFQYGHQYNIWQWGGPGNFGWLSWDATHNDAPYLAQELDPSQNKLGGYHDPGATHCATIAVGCWVKGEPGVKSSTAVTDQMTAWERGTRGPMVIVIYDTTIGAGGEKLDYHIVGFAAFNVTFYDLSGKDIEGEFVQWLTVAPIGTNGITTGLTSIRLSQ